MTVLLGTPAEPVELEECRRYFAWADAKYGRSVVFALLEADFVGMKHDPAAALQVVQEMGRLPEVAQFPALLAGIRLAERKFLLTMMRWREAAAASRDAALAFSNSGRRTTVPVLSLSTAFALLA
eukprot:2772494-Prymnesium_polylepis.3